MAVTFHVYVEGPVDRSPRGIDELAAAISSKFGLPAADLVKRMTAGRFRVKAHVDENTARDYRHALEQVGAVVTVEDAHPTQPNPLVSGDPERRQNSAVTRPAESERSNRYSVSPPMSSARTMMSDGRGKTPTTPPGPQRTRTKSVPPTHRGATPSTPPYEARSASPSMPPFDPRAGSPSVPPPARPASSSLPPPTTPRPPASPLPPPTGSRPNTSSLPPATTPKPAAQFSSGLSAAYSQEVPTSSDLGALGNDAFALSSLDGSAPGEPPITFTSNSQGMPASIGPAPEQRPTAPAKPAPTAALDLFAPPDAEEAEVAVELASDEVADRARKASLAPPTLAALPSTAIPAARARASIPIPVSGGVFAPEMPRARFAAGVLLSILLGFVPAHLIAASREDSAFAAIDAQVMAIQIAADTPEAFEAIDAFRDTQLARKKSERRSIALTSMLLWAAAAAGLAYVWFRRVPWDRFSRPS